MSSSTVTAPPRQEGDRPLKLAIFGTHPQQFNGYAKVVYELIRQMSAMHAAVKVHVFGFQNIQGEHKLRTDIPENVSIYDALAEENPKKQGFGIELVQDYVRLCDPDVVVIYNDLSIITQILLQLRQVPDRRFKIITYIDQVYLSQKTEFIEIVNATADFAFAFSPNWQKCIQDQGLRVPCDHISHGINPLMYFPIPQKLLRRFYGFHEDDFIILNMNRNQPRKRWDVCMKALAKVVAMHRGAPIKMIVATAPRGAWTLPDIFAKELRKYDIPSDEGLRHLVFVDTPQRMSDREVNMLYNVSDIGVNTCDGEGFGLCNAEHATVGKPQVVSKLGAFPDIFDDDSALLVTPKCEFYLDNSRDILGGEGLLCSHHDVADAIDAYYKDRGLRERHGAAARAKILREYRWELIARKFVQVSRAVYGLPELAVPDMYAKPAPRETRLPSGTPEFLPSRSAVKKEAEEDVEYDIVHETEKMLSAGTTPSESSRNGNMTATGGSDAEDSAGKKEKGDEKSNSDDAENNKKQSDNDKVSRRDKKKTKPEDGAKKKRGPQVDLQAMQKELARMQELMMQALTSQAQQNKKEHRGKTAGEEEENDNDSEESSTADSE